jgi:hypothetical protein
VLAKTNAQVKITIMIIQLEYAKNAIHLVRLAVDRKAQIAYPVVDPAFFMEDIV